MVRAGCGENDEGCSDEVESFHLDDTLGGRLMEWNLGSGSNLTPADSLTPTIGGVKYSPQVNGTASSQGMNGVGYSAVSSTGGPGLISNGTSNPSETYTHANLAERLPSLGPGSFVGAVLISLLFA